MRGKPGCEQPLDLPPEAVDRGHSRCCRSLVSCLRAGVGVSYRFAVPHQNRYSSKPQPSREILTAETKGRKFTPRPRQTPHSSLLLPAPPILGSGSPASPFLVASFKAAGAWGLLPPAGPVGECIKGIARMQIKSSAAVLSDDLFQRRGSINGNASRMYRVKT